MARVLIKDKASAFRDDLAQRGITVTWQDGELWAESETDISPEVIEQMHQNRHLLMSVPSKNNNKEATMAEKWEKIISDAQSSKLIPLADLLRICQSEGGHIENTED